MSLEILHRPALGSTASLGSLYDARTDTFCGGISIFKREIPDGTRILLDSAYSDVEYIKMDTYSDKFNKLNILASLQVSILMGLATLSGSGRYISDKKESSRSVRRSLVYSIRTKTEKLNIVHEDLKGVFSVDALSIASKATHFVSEIQWGAKTMLTCENENSENLDSTDIGGALEAYVKYAGVEISGKAEIDYEKRDEMRNTTYKLRVYGDVMPNDEMPTTVESAVDLMRQVPILVEGINDGKGKPIYYSLSPISGLKTYLEFDQGAENIVKDLDTSILQRVVKFFEAMQYTEQIVHDLYSDITKFYYCFEDEEIDNVQTLRDDLEIHEIQVRYELSSVMKDARSGLVEIEEATNILDKYNTHELSPENVKQRVEEMHDIIEKIDFARSVTSRGAKYVGKGGSIANEIGESFDKMLILFYVYPNANQDFQRFTENTQLFFREMKKERKGIAKYIVVDCGFLASCGDDGLSSKIQVMQNGVLLEDDLLQDEKQLQGRPVVEWREKPVLLVERPPRKDLVPFVMDCPGKTCQHPKKYSWFCMACGRSLLLGNDQHLYCECGKFHANSTRFKCSDPKHGLDFVEHTQVYINEMIKVLRPHDKCDGTTHVKENVCLKKGIEGDTCRWDRHCTGTLGCVQGMCWEV